MGSPSYVDDAVDQRESGTLVLLPRVEAIRSSSIARPWRCDV